MVKSRDLQIVSSFTTREKFFRGSHRAVSYHMEHDCMSILKSHEGSLTNYWSCRNSKKKGRVISAKPRFQTDAVLGQTYMWLRGTKTWVQFEGFKGHLFMYCGKSVLFLLQTKILTNYIFMGREGDKFLLPP